MVKPILVYHFSVLGDVCNSRLRMKCQIEHGLIYSGRSTVITETCLREITSPHEFLILSTVF